MAEENDWEYIPETDNLNEEEEKIMKSVGININGVEHVLTSSISAEMLLVDFIRDKVGAKGTKVLCREGGCGVCRVVVTVPDPSETEGGNRIFSVNACQVPVYSCSGWSVETVESLGNRYTGYNDIQKQLVSHYGTQCGYCSPGMVMSMYGEMKSKGEVTSEEVERCLDGNICRCTGYRPILDAFKTFATDAPKERKLLDIEEAHKSPCGKTTDYCRNSCQNVCSKVVHSGPQETSENAKIRWYEPVNIEALCRIMERSTDVTTKLVAGYTGTGVYKNEGPFQQYISLNKIPELSKVDITKYPVYFGARVSLSSCIEAFEKLAVVGPGLAGYGHLQEIADHWKLVANVGVRNNGSWAGNLMMRHQHREFPSDIFITLAACDATINIMDVTSKVLIPMKVTELDQEDMKNKIIVSMTLPPFKPTTLIRTQKVSRRAANAHAYVSTAIRISVDSADAYKVTSQPAIFYAGISPQFVSAANTAQYLTGKKLTALDFKEALQILGQEVVPDEDPLQGDVTYRQSLALALFYKTMLWITSDNLPPSLKLGGDKLVKSLTKGQQTFDENKTFWPMGQPVPKIESNRQVSGEAEYIDDLIPAHGELHAAFVQSTQANAKIDAVDATEALAAPGVVDFVSASDIPGYNSFVVNPSGGDDKVFATERVQYAGQSLGVIVAESKEEAKAAALLVKVTYSDIKKPVLTIKEAIKQGRVVRDKSVQSKSIQKKRETSDTEEIEDPVTPDNKIKGDMSIGSQFHFMMEPLCARVIPVEDGYEVAATTQWITGTQNAVAQTLAIPANSISMKVRRLGGGFGGKISRADLPACAAAVAAFKLKRPVRITLDLQSHMTLVGWRDPFYATYEVGFSNAGKLEEVDLKMYADSGFVSNDSSAFVAKVYAKNVYNCPNWNIEAHTALTDTAANTWCRTPGNAQGMAFMENILEHVANYLQMDPLELRELNLYDKQPSRGGDNKFKSAVLPMLKEKASLEERKNAVEKFNHENKWRKRGLSVTPFYYPLYYPGSFRYATTVVIYDYDGSVCITHGGIEMGQGINTKAAQVAAQVLGVSLSLVTVKDSDNTSSANSSVTGGSFGSDLVAYGMSVCCGKLKEKIEEQKKKITKENPTWLEIIKFCVRNNVDLTERYWTDTSSRISGYDIYGGGSVEVEIDVLTGQHVIRRVDIIEDVGQSLSPLVDMGQVEGAFIMGVGLFTTEELHHDSSTGSKLTDSTWHYKVPTALDIPEDFRVTFLPNENRDGGMLGSKATGEPPFCLSYGIVTALRQAIKAAREDQKVTGWFTLNTPVTVEKVKELCYVAPLPQHLEPFEVQK